MSDNYDYEALDEDIFPRSNGSHLPRPKDRSLSRFRTRSPPTRRTGDGSRFSNSRSRSRSPNRRYPNRQPSPVAHGHSQNDDHYDVLDEDRPLRSNGSQSPRPNQSRYASRSRSPPARRTRNFRSRSRSPGRPYSQRQRSPVPHRRPHYNESSGNGGHTSTNHPNPEPSRCLGVFGLSAYTEENDIRELFSRYGRIHEVRIIYDGQTKRSRGFGFIDFDNEDDAAEAKNRCNGIELAGRQIRVDFAVKQRPHKPTPGIYMGKIRSGGGRGYDRGGYVRDSRDRGGYDRRRSPARPSNYGRYPNSRSRSPSRQRHYR